MRICGGRTTGDGNGHPYTYEITTATHVRTVLGERTRLPYEIVEESTWALTSDALLKAWPEWQYGQQPPHDWTPLADDPGATVTRSRIAVHTFHDGFRSSPSRSGDTTEEQAEQRIREQDARSHAAELARAEGYPVTREKYERICAALGVAPIADGELYRSLDGLYRTDPGHHHLAGLRGEQASRERDAAEAEALRVREEAEWQAYQARRARGEPEPARRAWGAGGVRYDEACGRCGRVGEVDNDTGLCARHGGGA